MSKVTIATQPAPQANSEPSHGRDLSDVELNGIDGGLGVLSVAGSSKTSRRRPIDMRDEPRRLSPFTEA
ncbi:hypothetical protein [Hyphomicrobium sp.]|uniref:hypothetical protein n=1 Tax=Hyphomicrobium sp. TaxID=82 RepID=UPI002B63D815|nr:hypothetical protein [Hyphomicrobium sp.]HRN89694.1 hypothetical protein [Hyphomicrobium sp.]HRQ27688.1 hypothetical protein [Hyphomicrobium sp.]